MRRLRLAFAVVLASCSGDSAPSGPAPSIAVSASSATESLIPGGPAVVVTVTVTRTGGAAAPVDLSAGGLPAGVTATFSPAQLGATATISQLTLQAASGAAAATGSVSIGARSGALSASATVALTVLPAPDFTLALDSATIGLPLSTSTSLGVRITRTVSLTAPVALNVAGMPNGVTASFAAPSLQGGATSTLLTIRASGVAQAGTYPLVVSGQAAGVPSRTQALALTVTQSGGVSLQVRPNLVVVYPGRATRATVTVRRVAPFTGPVTLTAPESDSTVSYAWSRAVIPAGDSTSELIATGGVIRNSGTLRQVITANGAGVAQASQFVDVARAVTPANFQVVPEFLDTLRIAAGSASSIRLDVVRAPGFTTPLSMSATPLPGFGVSFAPSVGVQDSTRFTISVAGSVAPGVYVIDRFATAGGGLTEGAQTIVRVLPPTGTLVTFKACQPSNPPLLFAVQEEGQPWRAIPLVNDGFTFSVGSPRLVIARVQPLTPPSPHVSVILRYVTISEVENASTMDCDEPSGLSTTIAGTITGAGSDAVVVLTNGSSSGATFSINAGVLPPAFVRFARTSVTGARDAILRRQQSAAQLAAMAPADFSSAEPIPAVRHSITVNNSGSDPVLALSHVIPTERPRFLSGSGRTVVFRDAGASNTVPVSGLLASRLLPGDLQAFEAGVASPVVRRAARVLRTLSDVSVTLPPAPDTPTFSVDGPTNALRIRISGRLTGTGPRLLTTEVRHPLANGSTLLVFFHASTGWLGGDTYDLTMPDLSQLPGWNPAWVFRRGFSGDWIHSIYGTSQGTVYSAPQVNSTWTFSSTSGTYTP